MGKKKIIDIANKVICLEKKIEKATKENNNEELKNYELEVEKIVTSLSIEELIMMDDYIMEKYYSDK